MFSEFIASPWLPAALACGVIGLVFLLSALGSLLRLRIFRFIGYTLLGLLVLAIGAVAAVVGFGMKGYHALTHEEIAATIQVRPIGPQRFIATVRFPDGRETKHELTGDEIYIDAHILKWQPIANMFGLHTVYELDRIGGRYQSLADERALSRTVHGLSTSKLVDLFGLRRRYILLAPLLDAQYGSASFVPVTKPAEFEVRVSPTGLLIRERAP
ncbi:MAG: phage holin family protein [Burkholderiaceae bacterium]